MRGLLQQSLHMPSKLGTKDGLMLATRPKVTSYGFNTIHVKAFLSG